MISAGAGSGKTYRLTQEMVQLLRRGVRASGIIATTFTAKAAAELQERVRTKLLEEGLTQQADELSNALIGTVHGLGVKLLKRFAFEAGVSPSVDIIAEEDQQIMFNQSLAMVLHQERVEMMERLCDRLGLNKKNNYDWRKEVKQITEIARTNAFGKTQLEESKWRSFQSFEHYLGNANKSSKTAYLQQLAQAIDAAINTLENSEDDTKITRTAITELKGLKREFQLKGDLYWWEIVKLTKLKVSKKSQEQLADLQTLAAQHEQLIAFRDDIRQYIHLLFDMANEAIEEFDRYKKQRGLVDYTDMEVSIKELLNHPQVQAVLKEELDLLMVDEFQDTSPMQLEIFLKLARLAKFSVWVGDPKQSIYGFRGAEPQLMQAIIQQNGGVRLEDIQDTSWRNREDIVCCTNAIFSKAFSDLPVEQVALKSVRTKGKTNKYFDAEPIEANEALLHWHFKLEGSGNTNQTWMNNGIAASIKV
ncbi:MAG: UvrD-helicase domain-containing protein [Saprospiraceae bacterium]|nr:UvrD-helicase domain-containing protein [Saprospiraceae bacterium]